MGAKLIKETMRGMANRSYMIRLRTKAGKNLRFVLKKLLGF